MNINMQCVLGCVSASPDSTLTLSMVQVHILHTDYDVVSHFSFKCLCWCSKSSKRNRGNKNKAIANSLATLKRQGSPERNQKKSIAKVWILKCLAMVAWSYLFVLLCLELGTTVEHLYVKLGGALDNLLPLTRRHVVGNLCSIGAVLHQKHLKLFDVVDNKLVPTAWKAMPRLLVGAIADIHQLGQTLKPKSKKSAYPWAYLRSRHQGG